MVPTLDDYYKDIPIDVKPKDDVFLDHIQFTDMMIEASLIIDFQKRNFYNVGNHDFFLCGYSHEKVTSMGYRFFEKAIHPDDIFLWTEMHNTILLSLHEQKFKQDEVHYFSCTFRIKNSLKFRKSAQYLMAYLKIKPVWVNRQLRFGLCLLSESVIKTSGNLRIHFKEKKFFCEYSRQFARWKQVKHIKLSPRERELIMWLKQGKNRKEIAEIMCIEMNTVDNTMKHIFEKLKVDNSIQATIYATNHRLLFHPESMAETEQQKRNNNENSDPVKR